MLLFQIIRVGMWAYNHDYFRLLGPPDPPWPQSRGQPRSRSIRAAKVARTATPASSKGEVMTTVLNPHDD